MKWNLDTKFYWDFVFLRATRQRKLLQAKWSYFPCFLITGSNRCAFLPRVTSNCIFEMRTWLSLHFLWKLGVFSTCLAWPPAIFQNFCKHHNTKQYFIALNSIFILLKLANIYFTVIFPFLFTKSDFLQLAPSKWDVCCVFFFGHTPSLVKTGNNSDVCTLSIPNSTCMHKIIEVKNNPCKH